MTLIDAPLTVPEQRLLIEDADWALYESMLDRLENRRLFLTYDRGRLEIMAPSSEHDTYAELAATLIRILCQETNTPYSGKGSTTFRRKDMEAGLEPDRCFYIQNVAAIQGKKRLDLRVDPPPDLAIEIEITARLLNRVGIYERLGVNELWRPDGARLRVFHRGSDGKYHASDTSPLFPWIPVEVLNELLQSAWEMENELQWDKAVRAKVRGILNRAKSS